METILYLLANIYVSVVCKVAIKQYCFFFFVLLSCAQDKCLPIAITWWVDRWTQYSYCSTVYSWIFTHLELPINQIVPHKMRRRWNSHLEKEEEFTTKKKIIRERMILKEEEKRQKIDRRIQLSKWKRKLRNQFSVWKYLNVPDSVPELFNKGRKLLEEKEHAKQQHLGKRK